MVGRLWSYTTGDKGLNRIRVYERRPNGPIYVEWYDRDGRHQQSLRSATGTAILDKKLAQQLADAMAMAQRRKREGHVAATLLGMPEPRTLGELLQTYHDAHPSWVDGYKRDQRSNRRFWEQWLGKDVQLTDVSADRAQRALRRGIAADAEAKKRKHGLGKGLSKRTEQKRVRYLKDAFTYAQKKLKWITEEHNLSALTPPRPDSISLPYSNDEIARLLPATEKIDLRVAVMAHVTWIAGRRANALRTLPISAYRVEGDLDEFGVIQMPGATDKARKSGEVYVYGHVKELVEELIATPAAKASELLFPSGDLFSARGRTRDDQPVSDQWLRDKLREAEALADIPNIPGRAYHGIKRRYATESVRHDAEAASKQSGTSLATLRNTYFQDDAEPKKRLAIHMDRLIISDEEE